MISIIVSASVLSVFILMSTVSFALRISIFITCVSRWCFMRKVVFLWFRFTSSIFRSVKERIVISPNLGELTLARPRIGSL
jgi:hypothetical protein